MRGDSVDVVPEGTHGEAKWKNSTSYEGGGGRGRGVTSYLCGFLPPGDEESDMPGAGLSGSSA